MPAPIGPLAQQVTSDAIRTAVDIDVSTIVTRLETETMRILNEIGNQNLPADELVRELTTRLRDLSDQPINRAARGAASESFNLGKNMEIQRRPDQVDRVVRSEVLDEATCDPCRELDGQEFDINTDAYFENMPPALCEGREFCRGFYIPVAA